MQDNLAKQDARQNEKVKALLSQIVGLIILRRAIRRYLSIKELPKVKAA